MSRALTSEEKLRYPWASQITDFTPVGRWRRAALTVAGVGLAWYVLGVLFIFFFTSHLDMRRGLPDGAVEAAVLWPAMGLIALGFLGGLATGVQAVVRAARTPLVWSVFAMLPGLLLGIILLIAR